MDKNEPQFVEVKNKWGMFGCDECYFFLKCLRSHFARLCLVSDGYHYELIPNYKEK